MKKTAPRPNRRRRTSLRKAALILGVLLSGAAVVVMLAQRGGRKKPRAAAPTPPPPVSFTCEVRPILAARCWSCHREGGTAQPPLDGEDVGTLLGAPGGKDNSPLLPADETHHELLSLQERSLLVRWRTEGAHWQPHWAFQPLPDGVASPDGEPASIESFLERDRAAGAVPRPARADRLTLLRRVTLDLAGRPPTVAEAEEMLAAGNADSAYRATVDRLLDSPDFARNSAAWWLQTVCYSDGEPPGEGAPFRPWIDWVVRSFRDNRPVDEFLSEQVAGDQPDHGEAMATAVFLSPLRAGSATATPAEAVERLGRAFLGIPLAAGDLPAEEEARLAGLFRSVPAPIPALAALPAGLPQVLVASDAQRQEIADLDRTIGALLARRDQLPSREAFSEWAGQEGLLPVVPGLTALVDGNTAGPAIPNAALGQPATASAPAAKSATGVYQKALLLEDAAGLRIDGAPAPTLLYPWSVAFWLRLPGDAGPLCLLRAGDDHGGFLATHHAGVLSLCWWTGGRAQCLVLEARLPDEHLQQWNHLVLTCAGTGKTDGISLFLNGTGISLATTHNTLQKSPFAGGPGTTSLAFRADGKSSPPLVLDEVATYQRELSPVEARHLWDQTSLGEALAHPDDHQADLLSYYLANFNEPAAALRNELAAALQQRASLVAELSTIPVLRADGAPAGGGPVLAHLLAPASVRPVESRSELAAWLTGSDHPLTARVFVNRLWGHLLGSPFVEPTDNLGLTSGPCAHPELLDWLARDFIAGGWDFRKLCRQIVLSAPYREVRSAPRALPLPVQHDLPLHLAGRTDDTFWLWRDHAPGEATAPPESGSPLQDQTSRLRLARSLSEDLLANGPASDEERLRQLFLQLRCQDETHPEFTIWLGYLNLRREAAAKNPANAPVVVLGPGIEANPDIDLHEWALWLDLCNSLLEDSNVLSQW